MAAGRGGGGAGGANYFLCTRDSELTKHENIFALAAKANKSSLFPASLARLFSRASRGDCRRHMRTRRAATSPDNPRVAAAALAVRCRVVFNFLPKPRPPLVIRESDIRPCTCHNTWRCLLEALSSCAAMRFGDDSLIHGTGGLLSHQTTLPVLFRERETCLRNPFDQPRASAQRSERNTRGSDGSR